MASSRTIDHHRPIQYVEEDVGLPPGVAFTVTPASGNRRLAVSGNCPACGGRTSTDFSVGIGGTGSKGLRGPSGPPVRTAKLVTVICECGHAHPDRPDGAPDKGCGRFWLVELPPS